MEIKAESSASDFQNGIEFIKNTVATALDNRELVDVQFTKIKKYGFTWFLLTFARPFYALFGKDSFSHVRVDAVAQQLFSYCQLNKQHLTSSQGGIVVEILHKLDDKTGKKYQEAVEEQIFRIIALSLPALEFKLPPPVVISQDRQWQREFGAGFFTGMSVPHLDLQNRPFGFRAGYGVGSMRRGH